MWKGKSGKAPKAGPPGSDNPKYKTKYHWNTLFRSRRQIPYLVLFTLFTLIDIAALGLVSDQIHKYGGRSSLEPGQFTSAQHWPTGLYGHAMGLLMFATLLGLVWGIFHWAAGLRTHLVVWLMMAAFFGTAAGILEQSPFGHGLRCGNPASFFPEQYRPFVSQCTRVKALSGLAWALFGISVLLMFYSFFDRYDLHVKRSAVYDVEHETIGPDGHVKEEHDVEAGEHH